jgi:hypothetical protein
MGGFFILSIHFHKTFETPHKFHMLVDEYFNYIPKPIEHPIQKCICNTLNAMIW